VGFCLYYLFIDFLFFLRLYSWFTASLVMHAGTLPTEQDALIIGKIKDLYSVDEHGTLRRHVFLSINSALVIDRKPLADRVNEDHTVYIFQALTAG